MTGANSLASNLATSKLGAGDVIINLGNRALDLVELHPGMFVATVSLLVFGSVGRAAIKAGWTPEQVLGLSKAFPVQISIPTLSL